MLAELYTKMIEMACVPRAVTHFFVAPLDKPAKDPKQPANKRPIALLSSFAKLMELILVRRISPMVEKQLADEQYAYQRARSPEVLISDLDNFITNNRNNQRLTCVMGLDIAGAFDSASH